MAEEDAARPIETLVMESSLGDVRLTRKVLKGGRVVNTLHAAPP